MSNATFYEYEPDFVTPPGAILEEKIEEIGMTQADLAERIGRTRKTVNEIIKGKAPIEAETALQLERVLGIPARFWANAEANYRQFLAKQEEARRLEAQLVWLKKLPVRALVKLGYLPERKDRVTRLRDLLNLLGVASFEALDHIVEERSLAFRHSTARPVDSYALLVWLRLGELEAQNIQCSSYSESLFRNALQEIRRLCATPPDEAAARMRDLCARAGVALVFVPEIPGTRAFGVTQWVSAGKAILQLSLRGKTDDQFWFTFFHEAAHILLHPKRKIYIEFGEDTDQYEEEANRFARDILIPPDRWPEIAAARPRTKASVKSWAKQLGIAPGILVGRLQHERLLPFSHLNALKKKLSFKERQ